MKPMQYKLLERFRQVFPEAAIEVEDESHLHVGHAGAEAGAGHFRVQVIDAKFNDLPRIDRHQLVYNAVSDWMPKRVHALNITTMTQEEAGHSVTQWRSWMCLLCGWIYDEAAGLPDEDIAPGTRWEDVPSDWTCPECGAGKEDFDMVEV
mgnify:FL=1